MSFGCAAGGATSSESSRAGIRWRGAHGGDPAPVYGAASGQNFPSRTQSRPSRTKKMGLDCLGFLRPIRGFSMGYEQSKTKKLRKRPSSGGGRSASPARLFSARHPARLERLVAADSRRRNAFGGSGHSICPPIRRQGTNIEHLPDFGKQKSRFLKNVTRVPPAGRAANG